MAVPSALSGTPKVVVANHAAFLHALDEDVYPGGAPLMSHTAGRLPDTNAGVGWVAADGGGGGGGGGGSAELMWKASGVLRQAPCARKNPQPPLPPKANPVSQVTGIWHLTRIPPNRTQ